MDDVDDSSGVNTEWLPYVNGLGQINTSCWYESSRYQSGESAGGDVCADVALSACGDRTTPRTLDVATTTSVQNSGLLEALLSHFTASTVRVHAAGSGRALEMLQDGVVDLVISHAPDTEAKIRLWL